MTPPLKLRTLTPLYLLLSAIAFGITFQAAGLTVNLTPSLPYGIYQRVGSKPQTVGDLVAFCLPEPVARKAREHGTVLAGGCPGGAMPLLKRVLATEGTVVEITEQGTFLDDRHHQPRAWPTDHRQRPLERWPLGCYFLRHHQLWLGADHPNSFDSRYYGPVDARTVRGVYRPLWLWSF